MASAQWNPMTMTASASLQRSTMVSSSSVKSSYMRTRATFSSIVKFCLNGPIIDSMTTGMTTSGKSVRSGWVSKTPSISFTSHHERKRSIQVD